MAAVFSTEEVPYFVCNSTRLELRLCADKLVSVHTMARALRGSDDGISNCFVLSMITKIANSGEEEEEAQPFEG